jgi:U3 small nucleolar RNA-associated protein 10
MQTTETNRRLDEAIETFLSLVSPFFLLKASHKCLEYLIRRYSVHEHNQDALLKCALPYHASNVFVRLVQIMPLHRRWEFMSGVKKNGVPIDRRVLVDHAAKNRSILTFVAETVKEYIANKAQCKSLISFFVALVLETIGT